MRRLIFSVLLVLVGVLPAAAQTRIAGSGTSGEPLPYGGLNATLPTSGLCTSHVVVNQTSATTTQLVALTAGQSIYICGWSINTIGAAGPPTWKLVSGTGADCVTNTTDLTGVHTSTPTTTLVQNWDYGGAGGGYVIKATVAHAVCITTTTTTPQRGTLFYIKF
jgi:hypothetical protein